MDESILSTSDILVKIIKELICKFSFVPWIYRRTVTPANTGMFWSSVRSLSAWLRGAC